MKHIDMNDLTALIISSINEPNDFLSPKRVELFQYAIKLAYNLGLEVAASSVSFENIDLDRDEILKHKL
jgi:hypothetical protein